jgi:Tfp pilus assembly protein PilV
MERRKLKRTGAIFVEVIVCILLFTVGILALTGTLFYGVKMVTESRQETIKEQEYKNSVEKEILGIIQGSDPSPAGTSIGSDQIIINIRQMKILPFTLYRYKQEGKEGTEMYLIKRGNTP